MNTLRTSSAADSDIVECAVWLETKRPDLGNDFLDAVDAALLEIARHPVHALLWCWRTVNLSFLSVGFARSGFLIRSFFTSVRRKSWSMPSCIHNVTWKAY